MSIVANDGKTNSAHKQTVLFCWFYWSVVWLVVNEAPQIRVLFIQETYCKQGVNDDDDKNELKF